MTALEDARAGPTWAAIAPSTRQGSVAPNLAGYDRTCAEFPWNAARAELDGLLGGRGLNIAHEAVDRHAARPAPKGGVLGA